MTRTNELLKQGQGEDGVEDVWFCGCSPVMGASRNAYYPWDTESYHNEHESIFDINEKAMFYICHRNEAIKEVAYTIDKENI